MRALSMAARLRGRAATLTHRSSSRHSTTSHSTTSHSTTSHSNNLNLSNNDSLMKTYAQPRDLVFVRGSGCVLECGDGRRFLDCGAGIAVTALGHSDPDVAAAASDQAAKCVHLSNLYHNEHAGPLAAAITSCLPPPSTPSDPPTPSGHIDSNAKVFFANSGTEANEGAIKFARKFARATATNSNNKFRVLSFTGAFHGRTLGALSATHSAKYQAPFAPLVPGFDAAPFNDADAATAAITNDTCAVLVEPIQGEGGITPATPEFLRALRSACDATGALLVFDEIQCGVGRTGSLFAFQQTGVVPDIITMAKPLANGFPIGAIVVADRVARSIVPGDHGTTFGGSPFTTRIGRIVWNRIADPAFLAHVTDTGNYLIAKCKDLQSVSPLVSDVRGRGLMVGIQLRDSVSPSLFVDLARDRGVLVISAGRNTVRILPPLIISHAEIDHAVAVFEQVLGAMESIIGTGQDLPNSKL